MFVGSNNDLFMVNADLYLTETRNSHNIHLPSTHLTVFQKAVHYAGKTVFSYLPASIKRIASDTEVFTKTLKRFLMDNSSYSVDEFIKE